MEICKAHGSYRKFALFGKIELQPCHFIMIFFVQVSPDPDDPHAPGSVALIRDGCRNRDFASIIPHQVSNCYNEFLN